MDTDNQHRSETRHVSPDGYLTLLVINDDDDCTLGFEGHPWHTHGDILSSISGLPLETAVSQFIEALLNNQSVIAIAIVDGHVRDIWIADLPLKPDPYKPANETIAFRYWNGSKPELENNE